MTNKLDGKRIAILVTEGFEQVELTEPRKALRLSGATAHIVSPMQGEILAWNQADWGDSFTVDVLLERADPRDFHALLLPGCVIKRDRLRGNPQAAQFVRAFFEAGKPAAAISQGPGMLIAADVVRGRTLTSWPTLQADLRSAGANWVDQEVCTDDGLVTGRSPDDIPAFNRAMLEAFVRGARAREYGA